MSRDQLLLLLSQPPFCEIGESNREALAAYAVDGVEPRNEWLRAILRNDLYAVAMTEDKIDRTWADAKLILAACWDLLPTELWGSDENYDDHLTNKAREAQTIERRWKANIEARQNAQTIAGMIVKGRKV